MGRRDKGRFDLSDYANERGVVLVSDNKIDKKGRTRARPTDRSNRRAPVYGEIELRGLGPANTFQIQRSIYS